MNQSQPDIRPAQGFTLTHFITVADIKRSAEFYVRVFDGKQIMDEPAIVQIANSFIIINIGGGPTDDKPTVTLHPPEDKDRVSSFMNVRVADIHECYERWKSRGAEFLTEPKDHQHETRCYIRDPDGYLIEVGQSR